MDKQLKKQSNMILVNMKLFNPMFIQVQDIILNLFILYERNTDKFIRSIVILYTDNNFRMIADSNVTKFK